MKGANACKFLRVVALALALVLFLGLNLTAQGATTTRPIEDLLSQQGKYPPLPPNSNVPPDPNFSAWGSMAIIPGFIDRPDRGWAKKAVDNVILYAGVDYLGIAAVYENENYNGNMVVPEINGNVTERPLPDGRTEVTIIMHTKGANVWVMLLDYQGDVADQIANKLTLFGYRPRDVVAGKSPALGDCLLHMVYISPFEQGHVLPDLIEVIYGLPDPSDPSLPKYELKYVAFNVQAKGPLTAQFGVPDVVLRGNVL